MYLKICFLYRQKGVKAMDRVIIRWQALVLVGLVIIGAFVWAFSVNRQDLQETETREASLQRTLARLQNNQLTLTAELRQIGSNSYIENRARTDFAFLKPGELRFEVVNPEALEGYTAEEMQILMEEMVY